MSHALGPSVDGSASRRYAPLFTLMAGGVAGGATLAILVAPLIVLISRIPALRLGVIISAVCLGLGGLFFSSVRVLLPERSVQVFGSQLLRFSRERAAFGWGMELGQGYRTFIVTPVY